MLSSFRIKIQATTVNMAKYMNISKEVVKTWLAQDVNQIQGIKGQKTALAYAA